MSASDTRAALMDAAERAVREQGVDGFSYADLSRAVGIRKASIHYHFPGKADLLVAIMARYRARILAELELFAQDERAASASIASFLSLYRSALKDCTALCLCVASAVNPQGLDSRVTGEIQRFREAVVAWLESRFEVACQDGSVDAVGDPREEAAAALAMAEGGQIAARLAGSMTRFDLAVALLTQRLKGAAAIE
ncbi:TetR family transcriptional regulator [Marinobacteraceae bacterium S3BR75-40.1]